MQIAGVHLFLKAPVQEKQVHTIHVSRKHQKTSKNLAAHMQLAILNAIGQAATTWHPASVSH